MENRTKRTNKNIFRIIAILLCLVLVTSSVVSSTLAKFVITKDATTTVKFSKFGVKMQIKNGRELKNALDANSASVSWEMGNMYPGIAESNEILFAFDNGTLTVPAVLTITVDVTTNSNFRIAANAVSGVTSDTAYMPLKFIVGTVADTSASAYAGANKTDAWIAADSASNLDTALEKAIAAEIAKAMGVTDSNIDDAIVSKEFDKDSAITFKNDTKGIGFGLEWPMGDSSSTNDTAKLHNRIDTYITEQVGTNNNAITLKITVSLEQNGT